MFYRRKGINGIAESPQRYIIPRHAASVNPVIEEDKLYYFCLAYINPKEVLIVKAPTNGAKNKKFVIYECRA